MTVFNGTENLPKVRRIDNETLMDVRQYDSRDPDLHDLSFSQFGRMIFRDIVKQIITEETWHDYVERRDGGKFGEPQGVSDFNVSDDVELKGIYEQIGERHWPLNGNLLGVQITLNGYMHGMDTKHRKVMVKKNNTIDLHNIYLKICTLQAEMQHHIQAESKADLERRNQYDRVGALRDALTDKYSFIDSQTKPSYSIIPDFVTDAEKSVMTLFHLSDTQVMFIGELIHLWNGDKNE